MRELVLAPHIHTSASDDSDWDLERLCRWLGRSGFDGALVCDHDRTMNPARWQALQALCDAVGDRRSFLVVPGVEYQAPDHVVHIPVYGYGRFHGRSPDIDELLLGAAGTGAAVFAHPARRDAWRQFNPAWAPQLVGIEVWNRKYDGVSPNSWALGATREHEIPPLAALDWHGPRQLFPLALRVADPGPGRNRARAGAVVAALRAREVRATAFGGRIESYETGALATISQRLERIRRWGAPRLRQLEDALRRLP